MYANDNKPYEVPVSAVFMRYKSGKLGLAENREYEVFSQENGTYMKISGEQLGKLYNEYQSLWVCPYEVKGHPNDSAPPNLAPPDALLP